MSKHTMCVTMKIDADTSFHAAGDPETVMSLFKRFEELAGLEEDEEEEDDDETF